MELTYITFKDVISSLDNKSGIITISVSFHALYKQIRKDLKIKEYGINKNLLENFLDTLAELRALLLSVTSYRSTIHFDENIEEKLRSHIWVLIYNFVTNPAVWLKVIAHEDGTTTEDRVTRWSRLLSGFIRDLDVNINLTNEIKAHTDQYIKFMSSLVQTPVVTTCNNNDIDIIPSREENLLDEHDKLITIAKRISSYITTLDNEWYTSKYIFHGFNSWAGSWLGLKDIEQLETVLKYRKVTHELRDGELTWKLR